MRNIFGAFQIIVDRNSDDCPRLECIYDFDKKEYSMPSFHYKNGQEQYWDNQEFLFDEFYPILKRFKDRMLTFKDREEFKDIWYLMTEDWVNDVIEIF